MLRLLIYLLLIGALVYFYRAWKKKTSLQNDISSIPKHPARRFQAKSRPGELWIQVYETASLDEGLAIQARLQEEEIKCILYEQGKKDIQGNTLKGIGAAVPKSLMGRAQNIIARMLV